MHKPTRKTSVACHCSMNRTLSKKRTVHVVRGIAWNSSNHIGRICRFEKRRAIVDISDVVSFSTHIIILQFASLPTYIFESYTHCLLFSKIILLHQRLKMLNTSSRNYIHKHSSITKEQRMRNKAHLVMTLFVRITNIMGNLSTSTVIMFPPQATYKVI